MSDIVPPDLKSHPCFKYVTQSNHVRNLALCKVRGLQYSYFVVKVNKLLHGGAEYMKRGKLSILAMYHDHDILRMYSCEDSCNVSCMYDGIGDMLFSSPQRWCQVYCMDMSKLVQYIHISI